MLFDNTVHIGDVIIGAFMTAFGWGFRMLYKLGKQYAHEFEAHRRDLGIHAAVIDEHSSMLQRMGWKPSRPTMLGLSDRRSSERRTGSQAPEIEEIV